MKVKKGGGSQVGNPSCATCGKRHYGECLLGTRSFFGCGKYGHNVRVFPTIRGKQVPPNTPQGDALKKNHFCALWYKGSKPDKGDDDDGKL